MPSNSVLDILQTQLIPTIENHGLEQFIVARAKLRALEPHPNFRFTPQELQGPRVGVRSYAFNMTTAKWPQDHLVETPCPLLLFITSGKADLRLGDYWLHAAAGQGIFTLANVPRKDGSQPYLHPDNRKTGACSTINFSEARGRVNIWLNHSQGEVHERDAKPLYTLDDRALQLLNQMQHHFSGADAAGHVIGLHLLQTFLRTLQSDLRAGRFLQAGLMRNAQRKTLRHDDPVERARHYVRTHLHEPLTLQSVARQVYLSRTQFALRFRQETKQTFNQFVTACRMEQARVLLQETDYTLTFVCQAVGYRSLTYFSRVFTKHCGLSPQEFRQNRNTARRKER